MTPTIAVGVFSVLTVLFTHDGVHQASAARGSSAFFMSSCEGRVSPRKYTEPPCKIGQASYCTEPGEAYPRHAVRRFVSDNQGLMRRMYGDLRHLAVLRSEMEWNGVAEPKDSIFSGRSSPLGDVEADYVDAEEETNDVNALDVNNINVTLSTANPTTSVAPPTGNGTNTGNATTPLSVTATTAQSLSSGDVNDTANEPAEADKGINACPTRQEVVAPYWAINTRGRTLAVVNDPPYEQHIHWEKCLHENQQMLCRDGCKCEQQFRLQRLLAFDPACDCKGVFMDWFLLPSCCVCKCYGMSYNTTASATAPQNDDTGSNTNHNSSTPTGRRRGRHSNSEGSS